MPITETIYFKTTIYNVEVLLGGETFGDILRYNRMLKKLTQQDLADKIGVHICTIKRYEYNILKPSGKNLIALKKILGLIT